MNFFSKLFGNPSKREFKLKFREIQKDVEQRTRPLADIGIAIVKASNYCLKGMKPFMNDTDKKRKQEREIYVFYEFIYFFMHMTMRYAFGRLSKPQIAKLQGFLGPIIVGASIDSFFIHWPEDLKGKMRSEFYEKLNDAEIEYSSSKELLSKDKPFTGDSLTSKLARNVTQLIGDSMNPVTMIAVVNVSVRALIDAKLDQLINTVAPALDRLTDDELSAFCENLRCQHR